MAGSSVRPCYLRTGTNTSKGKKKKERERKNTHIGIKN